MKMRLFALVGLAISLALPTFAQEKETVDPKIIEQLDADGKKYDEAINNNDAAAVAALFTEDAVFVTDAGVLSGRWAAIGFEFCGDLFREHEAAMADKASFRG